MNQYLGILSGGIGEITEKKSRFIGYCQPVTNEEEAEAFITSIRKKHHDARHNCYAYTIGTGPQPLQRFSDDGEPQGTAGKPILEVIKGSDVRNLCIVVTRYFGGVLLGTGGLVRAYTDAAKAGLSACKILTFRPMSICTCSISYSDLKSIEYLIANSDASILDTQYTDTVTLTLQIYQPVYESVIKQITDLTGGSVVPTHTEDRYGACEGL